MFNRILVAIDGSDHSGKALAVACDIAKKYGAGLCITHSPQIETAAVVLGAGMVAIPETPGSYIEAGKQVLAEAAEKAAELGVTPKDTYLGDGDPREDILRFADLSEADLIVMGRRGLGGLASLFLGSVSQQVSHGAKCTCLTVHHSDR